MKSLKTLLIAGAAVAATTLSAGAMAMTPWQRAHAYHRQEHRVVRHEDHRINRAVEHGRITPHQARVLHAQNHNRY
ncbi:MAG TPA: hypothetical protein VGN52_18515 [Burkholderiales bacterium]|jgi:hypothetical protein